MCGIIGVYGREDARKVIEIGLKVMENRGKDDRGIVVNGNNGLGHNLHSIVNHILQPLEKCFVANCEIYNWKELKKKYSLSGDNDAEILLQLLKKRGVSCLSELDGVYAFAWDNGKKVIIARDLLGVKPLWFSCGESFAFASEKKALESAGFIGLEELNPRKVLVYDKESKSIEFSSRPFFTLRKHTDSKDRTKERLKSLLRNSVKKRIPDHKVGLLFSGGIDSSLIALLLKQLGVPFTCYTAGLKEEGMKEAEDVVWAKKVAKELDVPLKVREVSLKEVPDYLKKVVPLIEDSNVVKVGVALPFFIACELAKKDGVRVIFSGLGSEEIFAGYERHKQSSSINEECLFGLEQMHHRDLYRDDVVTMANGMELRLPFLDKALVKYALSIPEGWKVKDDVTKLILREVSKELGLPSDVSDRKKRAAQYGSRFDKAIEKLSKKNKSEYLRGFYPSRNVLLAGLFSGGKDSAYAMHVMKSMNYDIGCLVSIVSANESSYMFHTPNIKLVELQAEAMEIPLILKETIGKKEEELLDLKSALDEAKRKYKVEGIVVGALFSTYQRNRVQKIAEDVGLKVFAPLWHKNQELLLNELLDKKFEVIISSIAAEGLSNKWLGRSLDRRAVEELVALSKKFGLNPAGEGGEFESLVLDCPLFKKKLKVLKSTINVESNNTGQFIVEKAKLVGKDGFN